MVLGLITTVKLVAEFGKYAYGVFQTPYATYRSLAQKEDVRFLPFIVSFILFYLSLAGLAKGGLVIHPLLLTASFLKITAAILLSFMFSVTLFGLLGALLGGDVGWRRLIVLWAFSLLPTSIWFILASFFSLILPPPRTMSILGQLASGAFIALSWGILLWKGLLYYLTLRFGLKLDLFRIIVVSSIFFPLTFLYSLVMYHLGVFRVPFL